MSVRAEVIGQPSVRLEMSHDVAVSLAAVVGKVAGNANTYRADTQAIVDALEKVGIEPEYKRFTGSLSGAPK